LEEENFSGLARINRELIGRVEAVDSPQRVVLDMDSTAGQAGREDDAAEMPSFPVQ
jgi:hypothetical protein